MPGGVQNVRLIHNIYSPINVMKVCDPIQTFKISIYRQENPKNIGKLYNNTRRNKNHLFTAQYI